ncbi:MAG: Tn3 family transposase [Scytonematopsis contorta HA4267-MV1]|nr:Tn3 family transposase [Scytonematopsis contorta HA4267-MV1]
MATRELLTSSQRIGFTEIPSDISEFLIARYYTLNDYDLKVINSRRRVHNRLGFAVQLCYLRFPGRVWELGERVPKSILSYIALQLDVKPKVIKEYAQRDTTRREHLAEIQLYFGYESFHMSHYKQLSKWLMQLAWSTDKGIALVEALIEEMRRCKIIIPAISTVERLGWETRRRAQNKFYLSLTKNLTTAQKKELDGLLVLHQEKNRTQLIWLRQPPGVANPKNFLKVLDKFEFIRNLNLDKSCLTKVHHNRLVQLTRVGMKNTPAHIARLDDIRKYAILVAFLLETAAILIDTAISMHDKMMTKLFNRSENQRDKKFQHDGKAINEKVRLYAEVGDALINARNGQEDAYTAIESVLVWDKFVKSVEEAKKLARPVDFDYFDLLDNRYSQLRRYAPKLLSVFEFKASNAASPVLEALNVIKELNNTNRRHIPDNAPVSFVKPRWSKYVFKDGKIDRHYYEICALSELRDCLRSGDISVTGSRQYKDFEDYLLPQDQWLQVREKNEIPVAIITDFTTYIEQRQKLLIEQFDIVSKKIAANGLPGVTIENKKLVVSPIISDNSNGATQFRDRIYNLLPRIKLTDLLVEVDSWTGFTKYFTHLQTGELASDKIILLSTILADAINLGLVKMAEASPSPDLTFEKLAWVSDWYIRDETYSKALAELVNFHTKIPFATYWGDGKTSSSDAQRFKAAGPKSFNEEINAKYGTSRSVMFYTHISDQYGPYHTKVIYANDRDATHVLDGFMYHETDLKIEEHFTDTNGHTDHVFGITHILGFRFCPRMRDLSSKKLHFLDGIDTNSLLSPLLGDKINVKLIQTCWDDILRLATSISKGTVTASLMMRKLASYPRQNKLALALREVGKIERTLFTLYWLQSPQLRRKATSELNKGELKNSLARAVCFHRLGEIRDRSFEDQSLRASGLNLAIAAIVLWNTVYLENAVNWLKSQGVIIPDDYLQHLSPMGWEHINLTGDYVWNLKSESSLDNLRPLRTKKYNF